MLQRLIPHHIRLFSSLFSSRSPPSAHAFFFRYFTAFSGIKSCKISSGSALCAFPCLLTRFFLLLPVSLRASPSFCPPPYVLPPSFRRPSEKRQSIGGKTSERAVETFGKKAANCSSKGLSKKPAKAVVEKVGKSLLTEAGKSDMMDEDRQKRTGDGVRTISTVLRIDFI